MGGPPQMGGPPMGYDPQMSQPMMMGPPGGLVEPQASATLGAEAELEKLEAKKKAREEKDREKEIKSMAHMMRTGARNQDDNAACAKLLCAWGILNGLLWAVPLLGDSWW